MVPVLLVLLILGTLTAMPLQLVLRTPRLIVAPLQAALWQLVQPLPMHIAVAMRTTLQMAPGHVHHVLQAPTLQVMMLQVQRRPANNQ
jgi:hypothetical protein